MRIALGLTMLLRNAENLNTALQLGDSRTLVAVAVATMLSSFILIGFAVPVTAFVLCIALNLVLDNVAQTSGLSSIIASMCLIPMALAPAGRSLSVDSLIMRGNGMMGRFWRSAYNWWGPLTLDRAALSKFALLLTYAAILLSAGLLHLQFEVWREGVTNSWMFINPVANPHFHEPLLSVYEFSPSLYLLVTKLSTYGALVFQIGFLPLLLVSRWTKYGVILLEFGFVIGSVTLLALSWLGWMQLVLWLILFWNGWKLNIGGKERVAIFYDGANDSTRTLRRVIAAVDLFKIVEFVPVSQRTDAAGRMHGIDASGHMIAGYDLFLLLAGRIALLLPLWPFLAIGQLVVRRSAFRNRPPKATGSAAATPADEVATPQSSVVASSGSKELNAIFRGFMVTVAVMLVAFSVRLPIAVWFPEIAPVADASKATFGQAPLAVGLFQINAFNFPPIEGPLVAAEMTWKKPGVSAEGVMAIPPVRAEIPVSDILFYQVVVAWAGFKDNGFCFSRDFMANLANRPGMKAVINRPRYRDGEFTVRMRAFDVPSISDFRAHRFVGLRWQNICEATFRPQKPDRMEFIYFADGVRALAHRSPLPFPVSKAGVPAVMNFPCRSEAARVAYWFNRGHLPDRAATVRPLVQQLTERTLVPAPSPPLCLSSALKVYEAFDVDWRPGHLPKAAASCDADLAAARSFAEGMVGSQRRAVAEARLGAAEAASDSGDVATCLIATSDIRRAYYRWMRPKGL
jgi:hypothetical protein